MCSQWVGLSALRVLNTSRPLKVVQPLWIWGSNWGRPGRGKGGRAQPSSVKYTMAPTPGCTQHLPELWRVNTALTRTLRHDLTFHCWFLHKVAQPWSAVYLVSKYDSIHYFPVSQGNSQPWCALDVTANSWLTVEPSGQILKNILCDWMRNMHEVLRCLTNVDGHLEEERSLHSFSEGHISNWHHDAGLCRAFMGHGHSCFVSPILWEKEGKTAFWDLAVMKTNILLLFVVFFN